MESIDPERCVHFEKEMLTTLIEKLQDTSKLLQHFITSGQIEAGFGQMCSKDIESAISSIGTEGSELRFNELALGIACIYKALCPLLSLESPVESQARLQFVMTVFFQIIMGLSEFRIGFASRQLSNNANILKAHVPTFEELYYERGFIDRFYTSRRNTPSRMNPSQETLFNPNYDLFSNVFDTYSSFRVSEVPSSIMDLLDGTGENEPPQAPLGEQVDMASMVEVQVASNEPVNSLGAPDDNPQNRCGSQMPEMQNSQHSVMHNTHGSSSDQCAPQTINNQDSGLGNATQPHVNSSNGNEVREATNNSQGVSGSITATNHSGESATVPAGQSKTILVESPRVRTMLNKVTKTRTTRSERAAKATRVATKRRVTSNLSRSQLTNTQISLQDIQAAPSQNSMSFNEHAQMPAPARSSSNTNSNEVADNLDAEIVRTVKEIPHWQDLLQEKIDNNVLREELSTRAREIEEKYEKGSEMTVWLQNVQVSVIPQTASNWKSLFNLMFSKYNCESTSRREDLWKIVSGTMSLQFVLEIHTLFTFVRSSTHSAGLERLVGSVYITDELKANLTEMKEDIVNTFSILGHIAAEKEFIALSERIRYVRLANLLLEYIPEKYEKISKRMKNRTDVWRKINKYIYFELYPEHYEPPTEDYPPKCKLSSKEGKRIEDIVSRKLRKMDKWRKAVERFGEGILLLFSLKYPRGSSFLDDKVPINEWNAVLDFFAATEEQSNFSGYVRLAEVVLESLRNIQEDRNRPMCQLEKMSVFELTDWYTYSAENRCAYRLIELVEDVS